MSAYGTKKFFGDEAVQLTFPANFSKAEVLPRAFYPSEAGSPFQILIGTDFQSTYHEQKRLDANQSVMNGLQARRSMEQKLLTGPHNYHLPKPVLGQRRFANPSLGSESYSSARRDNSEDAPFRTVESGREGGLRGGVMRSLEGQEFYQKQLGRRIAQLNRINALAQGFAVQQGQQYRTENNTTSGSVDKVDFFIFIQSLLDAITEGDLSRFTVDNLKELIAMMFRFGPTMTVEDIDDTREAFDTMLISVRDGLSDEPNIANEPEKRAYAETLVLYVEKMRQYIGQIERNFNLQPRDKKTFSDSLRKSLGFEKLLKKGATVKSVLQEVRQVNPRVNDAVEDFDGGFDDDDDDDEDGDGRFNRPAETREDEEARGMPRQPFAGRADDPNRRRFGERSGAMATAPSFFGEEEDDGGQQFVAPLALSGAEPNAEAMGQANPQILVETLEQVIQSILQPLGYEKDEDPNVAVEFYYSEPSFFVREVEGAMTDRGFSKAQIAEAMLGSGMEVFSEYIAEHSGDTGPAPIQPPARAVGPMGLNLPIYRDDDDDGVADVVLPQQMAQPDDDPFLAMLRAIGIPTRSTMLANFRTAEQYRALGLRIPAELGGPYRMRADTTPKNAKAYIIKLIQKNYDPDW